MRNLPRIVFAASLALVLAASSVARAEDLSPSSRPDRGTIRAVSTIAPDTLDPQAFLEAQAAEADWLVYTPLLTYQHVQGTAGGTLIPGLATALPTVSADGRTYELTLRKGLVYSDGEAVQASDFAFTVKRAIRLDSGIKSFLTPYIEGAEAFDAGLAKSISGITTDDRSGKITIRLTQAYGGFANVLGLPNIGLVPKGTPMREEGQDPPPGVGPYMITSVAKRGGYKLERNPHFACLRIPGIPTGFADKIRMRIVPDEATEASMVLDNEADVFDGGDLVPAEMVSQVQAQAADRYSSRPTASTYFFFLNTTRAPFDNLKVRRAVNTALDRDQIAALSGGTINPDCYFLPAGIIGHPTAPCPYGTSPDIETAQQLVTESGAAGTPVTVWTQAEGPRRAYADYYTEMLNEIGLDASEEPVPNDEYFSLVTQGSIDPQTGFADWFQDFPNPADFYSLLDGRAIQEEGNFNFSKVDDPIVQAKLIPLTELPASKLSSVSRQWEELESYVASQAYVAPFGEQEVPKFYSDRIDYDQAVMHLQFGNDFSTMRLK